MVIGKRSATKLLLAAAIVACGVADENTHKYEDEEPVTIWLAKSGPFHNPQETYTYYSLPFCVPSGEFHTKKKSAGIGEILEGNALLQHSGMTANFKIDVPRTVLCSQKLSPTEAETFKYAISQHYWYQMYLDDLPIWGMVGQTVATAEELEQMEKDTVHEHEVRDAYLYTHKAFTIGYNDKEKRIIEVNLTTTEELQPIESDGSSSIEFSYSVKWVPVDKTFADRFNRYLDYSFFEHQIHWFSIFNSFMMVIFLCGLVSLILVRTLKNDYAKYSDTEMEIDGMDRDFVDDSGWKQVHGDVFRIPKHVALYAACYGAGMQLVALLFAVILLAIGGSLYVDQGALISASLICYALTSVVGGYASGSLYQQYYYPKRGPHWIKCMVMTTLMLPCTCFGVTVFLNILSSWHGTINVAPTSTLVWIVLVWFLVAVPLSVGGTILGRNWGGQANFPCRVNSLPRQIPEHRWTTHPVTIIALTGFLPFASLLVELYFVLTSFYNWKFYYVYGFLLIVIVILILMSVCVTIVATYVLLNSEDYRWPWVSFAGSASTAGYVFLYSIYYFIFKTEMSGFLQTAYYFSYMGVFCLALGLLCGAIGVAGARIFVRMIFSNLHVD
mmetsp:Transcript_22583/g.40038  ORF Transcript_22583/g.40038 Transcript_22583/m.40038 type:complete len:613 (-) Transcript_22583:36-1874(-)